VTVSSVDYRREGRPFFQLAPGRCIESAKGDEAAALVADGIRAVNLGDHRTALESFTGALALDSACLDAVYNIATVQLLEGKPLDAEPSLARCAAADTFPEIYYGKALAELQLGDKDAAVADLQAAVAIQPVYLDAQLKLGELLMKRKDRAGARHALSFAARADSTSSAAHQALAAMYQESGEADLARTESMRAARPPHKDSTAMRVAVEQFKNVTRDSGVAWLAVGMAEALTTEMTRFSPYRMLERIQIEAITRQMALKQAVGVETDQSPLQKALGAQALVTGSYQSVGAGLRIDGRLIDVQTGTILTTGSTSGSLSDLSRMQRTLALTLAGRSDALELSELPGGVSAEAQQRMAIAKKALYNGDADQARLLAGEALKIDPLALSLAGSMAVAMANEGRGKSMAVLPFENLTGHAADAGMGSGIQEALITNLRKSGNLSIVERSQIDKITAEIGLGQSGLIQESSATAVGGMLAAGVLLTGGYQVSGDKIRITAKLLDVVTAEVLLATDVSGKREALFDLEDKLAIRIIETLKEAPVADTAKQIDPTLQHTVDTTTSSLASETGESDSPAEVVDNRVETLARRLTFFVSPIGINFRPAGFTTLNVDAGVHFINEIFAMDGIVDIALNDLMPAVFGNSNTAGSVAAASITTFYRSFEAGAGWNFAWRWNSEESRVSFKSLKTPETGVRVDTLPPYRGGRTYTGDDANVTLNTTQGMIYAGCAVVRKRAKDSSRKTFRLYADCMFSPYMACSATENDRTAYRGYTTA
jgi:TolB-like protein